MLDHNSYATETFELPELKILILSPIMLNFCTDENVDEVINSAKNGQLRAKRKWKIYND
jgi:hypothetical protein